MDDITRRSEQDKPPGPSLPLFDGPGPSRRGSPATSRVAAATNALRRSSQAYKALKLIADAGGQGMTVDEIKITTGTLNSSYTARCSELDKRGLIEDSGNCRLTVSMAPAAVYVATPAGLAALAEAEGGSLGG